MEKTVRNMDKQEISLRLICEKQSGKMSFLEENLTKKEINQFELVGFITKGVNSQGELSWKVTDTANNCNSLYRKPNLIEKLKGYYCHYILKF